MLKMKRIRWSLLLIFTIFFSYVTCFASHHRSSYRDADDSLNNGGDDDADRDYLEFSKNNEDNLRSQHRNHNHHHQHHEQPQKHAANDDDDDEKQLEPVAESVNHPHHLSLPPVIKSGDAIAPPKPTTKQKKTKKRSNKHSKHSKIVEIDEIANKNINNFNRISSETDEDGDNVKYFAETRNDVDSERNRQKDKYLFDLPNKEYVDFDAVMQNGDQRRKLSDDFELDDEDSDEQESDEDEDGEVGETRKTAIITQFPSSDIFVSPIEKEDDEIVRQQQRNRSKGSKLSEKRHKINDEGKKSKKHKKVAKSRYQKVLRGDLSCMKDEDFTPAPSIENADIKYLRNDIYGVENSYLEAEYHCHKGYKLVSLSLAQDDQAAAEQVSAASSNELRKSETVQLVMNTTNLICHNKEWVGTFVPKCVKIKNVDKLYINECVETRNNCEHQCVNTVGSYTCRCMPGFEFDAKHKCKDINECTKSPCQDKCINLPGSYKCTCDNIPGTKLSADGHSCVISSDSATISQQTLSSSVVSVCPRGYYFNYTNDECEDFDECSVNNGGCQDICTNTDGSYYCSCQTGYIFGPDNKTCVVNNITSDITCPPLIPPKHGYLECSRPLDESRHHIANFPGSQCVLRCPNGFRVMGRYSQICGNDGQWQGSGDGACIRYPKPKLICPKNMMLETPPNDTRVVMPLPKPTTDVSWDTDITISPNYVKDLNLVLSTGIENITYTATHPLSRLRVSCQFSVNVVDGMPPVVKFCPETQHYTVARHHETIKVSWIEPIFEDNIKVTSVTKSNESGNHLGLGTHLITYEAKDAAGFASRCTFKIVINAPKRQILPLLYSKFYYL
ncbi:uncharacterized protein LOC134829016 [Culicoides brevitarsis]|uniref:uncharacterized protein LOC134829016 n=1 Tax=Culicoides brevitarsis TaxID=469753 RepID=UPI00307C0044